QRAGIGVAHLIEVDRGEPFTGEVHQHESDAASLARLHDRPTLFERRRCPAVVVLRECPAWLPRRLGPLLFLLVKLPRPADPAPLADQRGEGPDRARVDRRWRLRPRVHPTTSASSPAALNCRTASYAAALACAMTKARICGLAASQA